MAKSFNKLREKMTPEAREKAKLKAAQLMEDMPLYELREARKLSQERIGEILGKRQSNISRLEKNTDMYISTLKSYIEAMGGTLDIVARFPDGSVKINQFQQLDQGV